MNTKHEIYLQFCRDHIDDSQDKFFDALCEKFNISMNCALDIWYAEQRSWFDPKMIDVLIDMHHNPQNYSFFPSLSSGEFTWKDDRFHPL